MSQVGLSSNMESFTNDIQFQFIKLLLRFTLNCVQKSSSFFLFSNSQCNLDTASIDTATWRIFIVKGYYKCIFSLTKRFFFSPKDKKKSFASILNLKIIMDVPSNNSR